MILPTVEVPVGLPTPTVSLSQKLDMIGYRASIRRELSYFGPIVRMFITREELRDRLVQDLEEHRDEIYEEQELYVTLGILARDADLFQLRLDLLGEGVVGFYDTEREELYLVADASELSPGDILTYAHEYLHGLQQQHHDIHSTSQRLKVNTDARRAFSGLVEGDATLNELLYMFDFLDDAEQEAARQEAQDSPRDVFDSAPRVIQRTFLFPYQEGAQFVLSLFLTANAWEPVNAAFQDTPQSTEQVLHIEKFVSREVPVLVELPDLAGALGDGWTLLRQDTLGEFLLMAYLETDLSRGLAAVAAAGWGGDSYALVQGPEGQNLLVSRIVWDSAADGQEFYDAFLEFMRTRTGQEWEIVEELETKRVMETVDQSIHFELNDVETLLIIAPDSAVRETAQGALR